ncbi:acyltransferase family protein [Weeksellaceae bacterium Sa1CVA4]|uniref:Acyltransferase family protein n=2 Tax=Kaistella pullorum TaxID=2763074 RepID=A0ABR8WIW7_9FLAO|nr:acyltransferase family protein [Kaistella pullorum]
MMLFLHLFNRDYTGLFEPWIFIGNIPLSYYISLFCDACVPIFAFVSGYGLYFKFLQNRNRYKKNHQTRLKKLYLNLWIIVILFAVGLGIFIGKEGYPGSLLKLLLNLTALDPSYNGAWWFLTVYILFAFTSSFWFNLLERMNPYVFLLALLLVYAAAFYLRVYRNDIFENGIAKWVHRQSALYFCTLFQFMLGAFALKFNWHQKIRSLFQRVKFKNIAALAGIAILIMFHAAVPNFIIAPFTGLGFIFLFLQLHLSESLSKIIDFFTPHATNIWLVHMFFYMIYFPAFIYSPTYVLPIFGLLILCSLISSYLIKFIEIPLVELLFTPKSQAMH